MTSPVPGRSCHVRSLAWLDPRLPLLLLTLVTCVEVRSQGQASPIITINQGSLRGVREFVPSAQKWLFSFKGIPYAHPPVGRRRFQIPEMYNGWNRTQLFDRYGPSCPQLDTQGYPSSSISEDCLTLNIWIPEAPVGFRQYPVVVFVDGQLFWRQRAAKFPMQDLAAQDVVTVSINYRTNLFGFLTLRTEQAPGNLGLRDQQMALRWVQRYIGAFGGDRRQVTLMGFSAGAASVGYHLLCPTSQGLFQRAVMMSGSPLAAWAHMSINDAERLAQDLAAIMGCSRSLVEASLRCLQDQDFVRLLTAAQRLLESRSRFFPVFAPITDTFLPAQSQMVPSDPGSMLRYGNYAKVPTMAGISHDDGLLMLYQYPGTDRLTFSNLTLIMRRVVVPRLLQQYRLDGEATLMKQVLAYKYIDSVPAGSQELMLASFVQIFGDAYFTAPLYEFIEQYSQAGGVVYSYGFTERGPDIFGNVVNYQGAGHGSELLYLLGPTMFRLLVGNAYGLHQQRLSNKMRQYWRSFIFDGDPSHVGLEDRWHRFTADRPVFFNLANSLIQLGYQKEAADYWNKFLRLIESGGTTTNPVYPSTSQALTDSSQPYQAIMWVLLAIILLLLVVLACGLVLNHRWRRSRSDLSFR